MLSIAGLQVPVTPLVEVVGSAGIGAPEQYVPGAGNVGVAIGLIVIVRVVVVAHCPGFGVKV